MPSQLSFSATRFLRDKLLTRNLTPYNKPGVYTSTSTPSTGDLILSDYAVIDSPDVLIDSSPFSDKLYVNNVYGPSGGYNKDINGLINVQQTTSNVGPYGATPPFTNALQEYSESFQKRLYIKNEYTPDNGFPYYELGDIVQVQKNATYWYPPSFRPSLYSPFSVLLQADPVGDNGPVSVDSELAQLGVKGAKQGFQYRVDQNVRAATIGRVNILTGLSDPFNLSQIIAGKRPIVVSDWTITSGGNLLSQGMDIVQRITGVQFPFSPIPGSYYQARDFGTAQSAERAAGNGKRGGLFGLFGSRPTSPSQVFLDFTGSGQRGQLTQNLATNRYRPQYNTGGTGILSALGQAILGAFANNSSEGTYYVGSPQREPAFLTSPPGQIPIDSFGGQVNAPVFGPDILGKEYEGVDKDFKFGLAGKPFEDGGNIVGGFTWVSGKWAESAGKYQKPGGDYGDEDPAFASIANQLTSTQSIDYEFRPNSILDNTQRLIDSQPNSGARFGHVGNAISQTSKVFFDGYKEITKGSQVIRYSDGQANVGIEYCRVFTKDTPYYTFNSLQKKEGNIRKFSNSILDATFSLNIAPEKGGDSIVNGKVKKYMFSVENLAWRTGYRPGFRVSDLPVCEQGPNGGRIMWFPPYDLSFTEDTRPTFNETTFLGRPEPVYTYKNTSRSGTLKWKMVVDHPSILNVIVNKVLSNEGDRQKVDSIVNSFFAGCKKYDLYELGKIYNTIPLTELQAWQEVANNPQATNENIASVFANTSTEVGTAPQTGGNQTQATAEQSLSNFVEYGFYFDNDIPKQNPNTTTETPFQSTYDTYTSSTNKQKYQQNATSATTVSTFFKNIVEENFTQMKTLVEKIYDLLSQKQAEKIIIDLRGSASSPNTEKYNNLLSQRRISSVENFFKTYTFAGGKSVNEFIGNSLVINGLGVGENIVIANPKGIASSFGSVNCNEDLTGKNKIYSTNAMACRTVIVSNITIQAPQPQPAPNNTTSQEVIAATGNNQEPKKPGQDTLISPVPDEILFKGASKKLLRYLLNECDYFEVMKAENPFIYDSIKEKIKYFQPAFHSTTPEGLNSRLTFLQQCMRPGDTIPTIGPSGEKLYNDALNTSFGAPPVLVLRVGDFYNTKIIPTSINFAYQTFDFNPEGIGFQPMIVDVNLAFNFVGGSGLANPVDTLQNALSFNYYANTEMYDERAEATEDTSKLDKEIITAIRDQQAVVGVSNVDTQISTDGGNTIGVFSATGTTASGQTGTLTYAPFMNKLVEQSQSYYNGVINMFDSVLTNYNYGILSMLNYGEKNQTYNTGNFSSSSNLAVELYGKPAKTQTFVDDAFKDLLKDIDDGDIVIFTSFEFQNPIITNAQKRLFKKNYTNYVNTYRSTFLNTLTEPVSTLVSSQQSYVFNIDRLNFVASGTTNGYDGKLNEKNIAILYTISGTPEDVNGTTIDSLTSLRNDYITIGNSNNTFLAGLTDAQLYETDDYNPKEPGTWKLPTEGFDYFDYESLDKYKLREYTLMSRALLQKDLKEGFLNALVLGLDQATTNAILFYYDTSRLSLRFQWDNANKSGLNLLNTYKTGDVAKNFLKFTPPFGSTQKRITVFAEDLVAPESNKKTLQTIYSNKNDSKKTNPYNLKRKFN